MTNDADQTSRSGSAPTDRGVAAPLAEQLRSVPHDAVLRIDTPNALGCMDTRSIPVGRLCHEAAAAIGANFTTLWQPIETAPRNGWTVLLAESGYVDSGFWHDGSECHGHRGGAGWFSEDDRNNLLIARNVHPTHWMPFPDAPAKEAQASDSADTGRHGSDKPESVGAADTEGTGAKR